MVVTSQVLRVLGPLGTEWGLNCVSMRVRSGSVCVRSGSVLVRTQCVSMRVNASQCVSMRVRSGSVSVRVNASGQVRCC